MLVSLVINNTYEKMIGLILLIVMMLDKFALGQETEIHAASTDVMLYRDGISLTCRPKMNGVGFSKIYGIQLKKNVSSTTSINIVSVTIGESGVYWHDQSLRERAIASYNLSSVSNAMLQLDIDAKNVYCNDASHYTCEITGQFNDLSNGIRRAGLNLSVIVHPDKIDAITVCPSSGTEGSQGVYDVDKTIQLTCRSTVGNPPRNLLWCMKRSSDQSYSPLPFSDPRVFQEQPILIGCQNERRGILTYNVTNADDDTRFVCTTSITRKASDCSSGPVQSVFYLKKNSTDSVHSVCNALVNEGKVTSAMSIEGITVHPQKTTNVYITGSQIRMSCTGHTSGSVSILKMHWCIKRKYDNDFYLYPFDMHVKDDVVKSVGICIYKMNSTLYYNVTMADSETEIMCQIGVTGMKSVCGYGKLNRRIVIKSMDQRVTTSPMTSSVTYLTTEKITQEDTTTLLTTQTTVTDNEHGPSSDSNELAAGRGIQMIMLLLCIFVSLG